MKVLIVALGLEPPWTEGRKNMLRDLIPVLSRHVDLRILSVGRSNFKCEDFFSIGSRYYQRHRKPSQFVTLMLHLWKDLNSWRPDFIFHFPYGTFSGLRGVMNYATLLCVNRISFLNRVPCLTTLYSMTNGNLNRLQRLAHPCATVGVEGWAGYAVNTGIKKIQNDQFQPTNSKKLLFMAGYQDDNPRLLASILHDRGLIDILKIGTELAHDGFSLSVAIPLLRYPKREFELTSLIDRYCRDLPVTLYTQEFISELAEAHSLFIFPYRKHHNVFIPTSVLEAMSIGIPVVLSDQPMFRPLIESGVEKIARTYEPGNKKALLDTILQATTDWKFTENCARRARIYVREHWSIEKTAEQMLAIAQDILHP